MLDFDMLGSPNFARFVYDGDGSELGFSGPEGSGAIEGILKGYFDGQGLFSEPVAFDGRSDYGAFTDVGIPAGGVFTGAEVHKTPAQQAIYGGTVSTGLAGQFDPCYHLAATCSPTSARSCSMRWPTPRRTRSSRSRRARASSTGSVGRATSARSDRSTTPPGTPCRRAA